MSDHRLRNLERKAATGDPQAAQKLAREQARIAKIPAPRLKTLWRLAGDVAYAGTAPPSELTEYELWIVRTRAARLEAAEAALVAYSPAHSDRLTERYNRYAEFVRTRSAQLASGHEWRPAPSELKSEGVYYLAGPLPLALGIAVTSRATYHDAGFLMDPTARSFEEAIRRGERIADARDRLAGSRFGNRPAQWDRSDGLGRRWWRAGWGSSWVHVTEMPAGIWLEVGDDCGGERAAYRVGVNLTHDQREETLRAMGLELAEDNDA